MLNLVQLLADELSLKTSQIQAALEPVTINWIQSYHQVS